MTSPKPRPYQANDIKHLRVLFRDHQRVLYCLPTGGGKTFVMGWIARELRQAGYKVLILVHRDELVNQFAKSLDFFGLNEQVGIISRNHTPTAWAPIQIAMVFTYAKRIIDYFEPDFIFVDESHHIRATSWDSVLQRYGEARVLGCTATPKRLDG